MSSVPNTGFTVKSYCKSKRRRVIKALPLPPILPPLDDLTKKAPKWREFLDYTKNPPRYVLDLTESDDGITEAESDVY